MPESIKTDRLVRRAGGKPLYMILAGVLSQSIASGYYPVGRTLPSEKEMTVIHGVSRQTVRQAIAVLKRQGLVSSRPGIGSIVLPSPQGPELFRPITRGTDLMEFFAATELHRVSHERVQSNEELSRLLECRRGTQLSEACFLRKRPSNALAMCVLRAYVPVKFAAAQLTPPVASGPLFRNIERMFGEQITEVRQDVTAAILDRSSAELLQAAPGDAALRVVRFYFANGRPIQVAVSIYPSSRFRQSINFTLDPTDRGDACPGRGEGQD